MKEEYSAVEKRERERDKLIKPKVFSIKSTGYLIRLNFWMYKIMISKGENQGSIEKIEVHLVPPYRCKYHQNKNLIFSISEDQHQHQTDHNQY